LPDFCNREFVHPGILPFQRSLQTPQASVLLIVTRPFPLVGIQGDSQRLSSPNCSNSTAAKTVPPNFPIDNTHRPLPSSFLNTAFDFNCFFFFHPGPPLLCEEPPSLLASQSELIFPRLFPLNSGFTWNQYAPPLPRQYPHFKGYHFSPPTTRYNYRFLVV